MEKTKSVAGTEFPRIKVVMDSKFNFSDATEEQRQNMMQVKLPALPSGRLTRCRLLNYSIPVSWNQTIDNNTPESMNAGRYRLNFQESVGGNFTVDIPAKASFDAVTYATYIQSIFNGSGTTLTYSVTYNTSGVNINRYTISATGTFRFNPLTFTTGESYISIWPTLGIPFDTALGFSASYTSEGIPDMAPFFHSLYICSNTISSNSYSPKTTPIGLVSSSSPVYGSMDTNIGNILHSIPISGQFNTLTEVITDPKWVEVNSSDNHIELYLVNSEFRRFHRNSVPWMATLEFE